jgi:2-oxoglutarate dehydrogenase E2 component (dihydrolipoamide succinyltransferase)
MDVVMPQLGETVERGTVAAWLKKVGDRVQKDEPLFEVSTDKVETEIPAPVSGVLKAIHVPVGETVKVGTALATIEVAGEAKAPAAAVSGASVRPERSEAESKGEGRAGRDRLSPVVKRLLAEHGVDAAQIEGTGAEGRITRDDVLAYVARNANANSNTVPLSRLRKLTAESTVRALATSAHVLQAVEVDFSAVDRARGAKGEAFRASAGFPLTYLPFVARAVCEAIREFPHVNASLEGDRLVLHPAVNLGVAVDLAFEGLMVPVVKDAQRLGVADLARQMHRLADRARRGALSPDDVAGGTYTLSNNGSFGTLITAPIIHQPQVAILSTDGVRKRPVVVEGPEGDAIAIRPVGILAQSFDHRAFDGAYSAAFLRHVKDALERRDWAEELR